MNIQNNDRPIYASTGYDHIDSGFIQTQIEAPTTAAWASYKSLTDPVTAKLGSTRSDLIAQSGQAIAAEFDFWTIANAYSIDSYLSTAIDKYLRLISKEGWSIKGKNIKAVEYIKQRIALLKITSGLTLNDILQDIEFGTVLFANAFLIKVPFKGANPIPGMNLKQVGKAKPIGGYFPVHPGRMRPIIDDQGVLTEWVFLVGGSEQKRFKKEEVLHITHNKPTNYLYGQPHFLSVLEDIRTYRQLEYLTVMLLNRYLHPLVHVRKGIDPTGKQIFKVNDADLQKLDTLLKSASADGIFVTGPDVSIDVKGVESQAIRAADYLAMWRKRIFAGLAVSDIAMGESSAGTRSTADAITAEMHDSAKGYQKSISEAINSGIIFDWLIEGGFDPIKEPDCAKFVYKSIAIDEDIKQRNQLIQEWFSGLYTYDRYRELMGENPSTPADFATTYLGLQASSAASNPAQGTTASRTAPTAAASGKTAAKPATKKPDNKQVKKK